MSPDFLSEYFVRIMVLSNNDEDLLFAKNVYCNDNPKDAFMDLFVQRNIESLNTGCDHPQPKLNISLANSQSIVALPSTFIKHKNVVYLGVLPNDKL
jgi:hypothetical protein